MRRLLPGPLRRALRRLAGALAASAGLPLARAADALLRRTPLRAGVAVVYHRVGDPPGDPARELNPSVGTAVFEAQLDHLRRRHRVVAAAELMGEVRKRRRGEAFPVAITFDDDLASHAAVAAPLLRGRGLPATFFLCGATLEHPRAFWWERLQQAADRGLELEPQLASAGSIHRAAALIEDLAPPERDALAARLDELVGGEELPALSARDAALLAAEPFELGVHTRHHHPLTQLDDAALARALRDGRRALASVAGGEPSLLAYPHGRADSRVAQAARDAGCEAAFTTRPRAITGSSDPLLLGRVEAPPGSAGALALRLLKALVRRG